MTGISTKEKRRRAIAATAYHEAGHAVAAWWFCLKYKHVTIRPNADSLGHMLHSVPNWFRPDIESSDRVFLRAQRHIITSFAGQLAEAKLRGRPPRFGMESDNQNAVDMAFRFCGSRETTEAYLRYCWLMARDLVNERWPQIEALAAALMERETLNHLDAIEVINPGSAALRATLKKGLL
jgi:ATP-dependent Zn protease